MATSIKVPDLYVQFGCGFSAPEGWRNFDASPTLRFEKLPIVGRAYTRNSQRFPKNVEFGDIRTGLPIASQTCAGVYASHVLEHLSLEDFHVSLTEVFRLLRSGGIFALLSLTSTRWLALISMPTIGKMWTGVMGSCAARTWGMFPAHGAQEAYCVRPLAILSIYGCGTSTRWLMLSNATVLPAFGARSLETAQTLLSPKSKNPPDLLAPAQWKPFGLEVALSADAG